MKRSTLFVIALLVLLGLFALGAVVYQRGDAGAEAAARNQILLGRLHAPTIGAPDARVHIVEFLDPACETCRAFYPFVKNILAANAGKVKLSVRHAALHPGSEEVVRILEAAKLQDKYWPTLEALFASQDRWTVNHRVHAERAWPYLQGVGLDMERLKKDMTSPEVAQNLAQDTADAKALGVKMTPEYFVNGHPLTEFGDKQLLRLVQQEREKAYP